MTSMMYPVMFPTQQPQHFSSPHYYAMQSPVMTSMAFAPEELRCQYSSKRCENTRTNKKSGGLHKFCAVHREKANRNQMRLDHRRRVFKRMAQREQQRTGGSGSRSAPSSANSSPYKRVKDEDRDHDRDPDRDEYEHNHSRLIKVEDDLDIDLMPLALHSENAASSSSTLFDQQDLHILEALLFSDEDQAERAQEEDAASPSSSSSTHKPTQQHARSTRQAKSSADSSWSVNL